MGSGASQILPMKKEKLDDEGSVASDVLDSQQQDINYLDPPMPHIGEQVNINLLINRNKKMREICYNILDAVAHDSRQSMIEAKTIPVSDSTQRVLVTEEVTERMRRRTTKKDLRLGREANINEIQKALALRRNAHVVMNDNYSKVLVNKLEPIFIHEARATVSHPEDTAEQTRFE